MKSYLFFGVKSFSRNLAYRSEVWVRILGNLVIIFIQVSIWKALIGTGTIDGVNLSDMITYVMLSTVLSSILLTNVYGEVDGRLRSGDISIDLIKPINYPLYLFSNQMGHLVYQFIFTAIPTILIAIFFFDTDKPPEVIYLVFYVIFVLLALLLSFAIGYLIALVGFWFLTTMAGEWIAMTLIALFSGSFLPIWFYSPEWAIVAKELPFQYLSYVPNAVYLGKINTDEIAVTMLVGVIWLMFFYLLTTWLWSRLIKRLIIQGG